MVAELIRLILTGQKVEACFRLAPPTPFRAQIFMSMVETEAVFYIVSEKCVGVCSFTNAYTC